MALLLPGVGSVTPPRAVTVAVFTKSPVWLLGTLTPDRVRDAAALGIGTGH